jgi:hypothetical protein
VGEEPQRDPLASRRGGTGEGRVEPLKRQLAHAPTGSIPPPARD